MAQIQDAREEHGRLVLAFSSVTRGDLVKLAENAGFKHKEVGKGRVGTVGLEIRSGKNAVAHASGVRDFAGSAVLTVTTSAVARALWDAFKQGAPASELPPAAVQQSIQEYVEGQHDSPFQEVKGAGMSPLNWLWIAPLLVIIGALAWAGVKHAGDHHTPRSLARIVAEAQKPYVPQGFLDRFLAPDFSDLSEFVPRRFDYVGDDVAIVEGFMIRIPGVKEYLRQARRNSLPLSFRFDTRHGYHIDAIVMGEEAVASALEMEIVPLVLGAAPAVTEDGADESYRADAGIEYDSKRTFMDITRLAAAGVIVTEENEFVLVGQDYKVALKGEIHPGFREVLEHLMAIEGRGTLFLTLTEKFEWQDGRRTPQRRQLTRQIGYGVAAGIGFGDLYVVNASAGR